jgi:hypothetical protein
LSVAADTSEDHNPDSGYRAVRSFITTAKQPLKAVSQGGIGRGGGKVWLNANGQIAKVAIPSGGVAVAEATVVIEQLQRQDSSGRQVYAYEITARDGDRELADTEIDYIEITLPLDLTVVKPGDLESGRAFIRHSHDLTALLENNGPPVPVAHILSTDYVSDGKTGSVTFHVESLSAFEVALDNGGVAVVPPGNSPAPAAGGGGGGGGCFISTAADAQLLEIYGIVSQRLKEIYLLLIK